MPKKDWTKQAKKLFSSKGVDPLKMEITPYRDWRIVVIAFFVGLVVSFGFNIYMSVRINSDSFFATSQKKDEGVTLNKSGLTKVVEEFAAKEEVFNKVKTEGIVVVDPSL